jgi:hypothetical protein
LALGIAGVANAAVLNFSGTSTILLADFPPGQFTGGGVATINGSDGVIPAHLNTLRLAESRGQIQGTFTRIVTDPDTIANGVVALIYDQVGGLTGTWYGISGGAASTSTGGGIMGVGGVVKICILTTACTQYLPLVLNQPTTVNGVPGTGTKGVGVGGLITAGGYGGIRISLQAAPWTIKTATVIDQITPTGGPPRINITWVGKGWAHAPVSTTTSTAQPSGVVQLITPAQVVTNLPLGSSDKMAAFMITVVHFIPEPGLLLLLGSGVAGLAFLGRRKMRK